VEDDPRGFASVERPERRVTAQIMSSLRDAFMLLTRLCSRIPLCHVPHTSSSPTVASSSRWEQLCHDPRLLIHSAMLPSIHTAPIKPRSQISLTYIKKDIKSGPGHFADTPSELYHSRALTSSNRASPGQLSAFERQVDHGP